MDRIRQKDLDYYVNQINKATKSPLEPYTKQEDGTIKANIGNYHLDYAYSGVKLVRMDNAGGGISITSEGGYGTKRELCNWLRAFLAGLNYSD